MTVERERRLGLERLEDRSMLSGPSQLVVMSENIYMGADPVPAMLTSLTGIPAVSIPAVTQFWNDVQNTNFNERADAMVKQIANDQPDLVSLQEVMKYWTGPADSLWGLSKKADKVELDFLQILISKLAAKGVPYMPVAVTPLGDFEAPGFVNGVLRDVRLTDHLAILVRSDLMGSQVQISNVQGGPFGINLEFPTLTGGTLPIHRGWSSVDVSWGNTKFRFVNMVLETPPFPLVQAVQGAELLFGPTFTTLPVILAGDSNSDGSVPNAPNSHTYNLLVGAGFQDMWTQANPGDPGFTWGNEPGLKNPTAMSYQPLFQGPYRMDLVLCRGPFHAASMKRVGVLPTERTATGLWPSDHAGIVATINVTNQTATTTQGSTSLSKPWVALGFENHAFNASTTQPGRSTSPGSNTQYVRPTPLDSMIEMNETFYVTTSMTLPSPQSLILHGSDELVVTREDIIDACLASDDLLPSETGVISIDIASAER